MADVRRPTAWARLSFSQRIGLLTGALTMLAIALIPSGLHHIEGYGRRPAYAAGVAAMMAIWWLSEALPMAVTACVPLLLFPLLGVFGEGPVGDVKQSVEPFLDAYIFLFLGGMAIGAAMEQTRLHKRVALHIMRAIGTNPKRLLLGMLVSTAAISMWISNTATAVMMVPIGMAILAQLEAAMEGKRLHHFGGAIMLAIAYAANIGGIGTKIGTGTNSIFAGYVAEHMHIDIGFLAFMALGVPFVVLFLPIVWLALWQLAKKDAPDEKEAKRTLEAELAAMGPTRAEEKKVAVVFIVAAILWMAGDPIRDLIAPVVPAFWEGFKMKGKHYESWVAMSAGLALIVMGTLSFASIKKLPWATLALLGGSFAMASGIEGSGLSRWMAGELSAVAALPPLQQIGIASLATVILSAVASNTATINVALNVLPQSMPVLSASAIAASCDFMLPAGTPPNAIVFGSGYVRLPVMMKTGFLLDLGAAIFAALYAYLYAGHLFG